MARKLRLDSLSPDQEALLPAIRDEWLSVGLSTDRADRERAVSGVRAAYMAAKLPPPAIVVWLESPLQGVVGAEVLARLLDHLAKGQGGQVRGQVWDQVWDQVGDQVRGQVGDQVRGQVGDQVWDQVWDQVGDQVRDQVWDQVGGQVRGQVGGQVRDQVRDQVGGQVYHAVYGQHDAGWLAYYDAFSRFGLADITHPLDGLTEVARSAGWWWPFRGAVLLTERPLRLLRDAANRLHAEDGPAIVYPDGWGVHSWHGVRVPSWVIETPPEQITAKQIADETNAEVRRVLVERICLERYLELVDAKLVNRDDWGELLEVRLPVPMRVVKLVNSTPEPDGHSKVYVLRVPDTAARLAPDRCVSCGTDLARVPQTAHEAVAWSYSSCAADYRPAIQT